MLAGVRGLTGSSPARLSRLGSLGRVPPSVRADEILAPLARGRRSTGPDARGRRWRAGDKRARKRAAEISETVLGTSVQ